MDRLSKATGGYVSDKWDISDFEYKDLPSWEQGAASNRGFNIDYRLRVLKKWSDKYMVEDTIIYDMLMDKIIQIKTAIREGKLER